MARKGVHYAAARSSPGSELALRIPGRSLVRLEFQQDGSLIWTENGQRSVVQPGEDQSLGGLIDVGRTCFRCPSASGAPTSY